jgi:hypothetical protein
MRIAPVGTVIDFPGVFSGAVSCADRTCRPGVGARRRGRARRVPAAVLAGRRLRPRRLARAGVRAGRSSPFHGSGSHRARQRRGCGQGVLADRGDAGEHARLARSCAGVRAHSTRRRQHPRRSRRLAVQGRRRSLRGRRRDRESGARLPPATGRAAKFAMSRRAFSMAACACRRAKAGSWVWTWPRSMATSRASRIRCCILPDRVRARGAALLEFMRATPLNQRYRDELLALSIGGRGDARFDLQLPLAARLGEPVLAGQVELHDADLADAKWGLKFDQASGIVRFSREGFDAEGLDVQVGRRCGPVRDRRGCTHGRGRPPGRSQPARRHEGGIGDERLSRARSLLEPAARQGLLGPDAGGAAQPGSGAAESVAADADLGPARHRTRLAGAARQGRGSRRCPCACRCSCPRRATNSTCNSGRWRDSRRAWPRTRAISPGIWRSAANCRVLPTRAGLRVSGSAPSVDLGGWSSFFRRRRWRVAPILWSMCRPANST